MLNIATVMGRLTKEPDLRTTTNGTSVIAFTLACDRDYQTGGSERQTDWINCVAWRSTAEFISKYFHKGSMIVVNGSIQTRNYEDREGKTRQATELVVGNVWFGESKKSAEPTAEEPKPTFTDLGDDDGDLPF